MGDRSELHGVLLDLVTPNKVYFQPPENFKITYPCIVYSAIGYDLKYADSLTYNAKLKYEVTYISQAFDQRILDKLIFGLKYISPVEMYVYDKLYHCKFTLFF